MRRATHRLIAKVTEDLERWSFNTAVAACMEFANRLQRYSRSVHGPHGDEWDEAVDSVLLLLAPMAPHMTAEAWERRHGEGARIHSQSMAGRGPRLSHVDRVTMVVQVNGKVRDRIEVDAGIDADEATGLALGSARVAEMLAGEEPARVIARPPALVNLVTNTATAERSAVCNGDSGGARALEHLLPALGIGLVRRVEAEPVDHAAEPRHHEAPGCRRAVPTRRRSRPSRRRSDRPSVSHSPRLDRVLSSGCRSPQPWWSSTGLYAGVDP